jgi:serine/threonine-protein kinase
MRPEESEPFDTNTLIGKELDGRYRLEGVLGHGGMGVVFAATQTAVGRRVAVKTLYTSSAMKPLAFERFRREAEVAARLKHPNIVTIFDFGRTADGFCYLAMELLEGESLRQHVRRVGPLSLRRAVAIIEQVGLGLAHAHKHGVVHRDVKPHNVMLTSVDGAEYVKVLDFGLVKVNEHESEGALTTTGQVMGTPQYMSYEQAGGESVDARSDLYSLGAVLHYVLTGSSPFGANTLRKALTAMVLQPVPTVASKRTGAPVPEAVETFLQKALALEREARHESAEQFVAELRAAVAGVADAVLDARPTGGENSDSEMDATPHPRLSHSQFVLNSVEKAPSVPGAADSAGSLTTDPTLPTPGRRPLWLKVAVGAVSACAVLGAIAVLMFERMVTSDDLERREPAVAAPPKAAAPPNAADQVTVSLRSTPSGAAVLEDGVLVGKTPLDRKWPRDATRDVTFQLSGYVDLHRTFRLTRDEAFDVALEPSVKTPAAKPAKAPAKAPGVTAFE